MNVKRLLSTIVIAACISTTAPVYANPLSTDPAPVEKSADPMARLREIKDMDIQSLSRSEKKELRKEVKGIKREMKANNNGIYLSVGAIIIIILLLILLL